MVLNSVLDLPIRGLLATSGVIAIVLGLALQSTLADVFAGIAVGIEGPCSLGDRITIDDTLEGHIVQINWRSIHIRTDTNDVAIVPNSVFAKSKIINRSQPTSVAAGSIEIPCSASIAVDQVKELLERATMLCPDVLTNPSPAVALTRIGQRQNRYELAFSVAEAGMLWRAKSDLLMQAARQFRYEGISSPGIDSGRPAKEDSGSVKEVTRLAPMELLTEMPLFQPLSAASFSTLAAHLIEHRLPAGATLFSQGDADASLYIIASGVLEVKQTQQDRARSVGRIGPGDYVGEIGLLTGVPHVASVVAVTRCTVYQLKKEHLGSLLAEQPDLTQALEASARHGQQLLARSVAAGVSASADIAGPLLSRIREFFHLQKKAG